MMFNGILGETQYRQIDLNSNPNGEKVNEIKEKAESKIDSKWKRLHSQLLKKEMSVPIEAVRRIITNYFIDNIECLKNQEDEIIEMYRGLLTEYENWLTNISAQM